MGYKTAISVKKKHFDGELCPLMAEIADGSNDISLVNSCWSEF